MDSSKKIAKSILEENKQQSFKFTSVILILSAFVEIVFLILNNLHIVNYAVSVGDYIIIVSASFIILAASFVWLIPEHEKLVQIILYVASFEMILVYDYMFSYYAGFLILIPAIVSTRHYDKKMMLYSYIMVFLAFLTSALLSYHVATYYPDAALFKYKDSNMNFAKLSDCMVDFAFKIVAFSCIYGVICLISLNGRKLLSQHVSMTIVTSALEGDMQKASLIQNQVLPTDFQLAANDGIDIYASMMAAKEVAGDFYDFFKVGDNIYFLVGDVSDKGLYAAMFMMNVKNIIKSIALNVSNLDEIITQANKLICKDNKSLMFVTIWIAQFNVKTKKGYFLNAGHSPALIKNRQGEVKKLENEPQPFVGAFPLYSYKLEELQLNVGDSIFLYTDGATDALNNNEQPFGEENLINIVKKDAKCAKFLCDNVSQAINEFSNGQEQFDDITLLALTYHDFDFDQEFNTNRDSITKVIDSLNSDLMKNNVSEDTINLIDSAIDDELDNIISYAYESKNETFRFQYRIANNELKIVVTDKGMAFNPLKVKPADLSPDRSIGGLGIHLIKSIMDSVSYSRTDDENILVLVKIL